MLNITRAEQWDTGGSNFVEDHIAREPRGVACKSRPLAVLFFIGGARGREADKTSVTVVVDLCPRVLLCSNTSVFFVHSNPANTATVYIADQVVCGADLFSYIIDTYSSHC